MGVIEWMILAAVAAGAILGSAPLTLALMRERRRGARLEERSTRTAMQMDWLVRSLPIAMVVVDRHGRIECCSGGALAAVDHASHGVVGRSVHDQVYDSETLAQLARELVESDLPGAEFRIEGRTLQALHVSGPAPWDDSIVRAALDITPRVEAEAKARQLGQLLNSLVESVPHAIAMLELQLDGEYVYSFANRRFAVYAGHTVEEIVGSTPAEILAQRQLVTYETQLARAIRVGQPIQFDSTGGSWPREDAIVSTTLVPLASETGGYSSIIHVARDVTNERPAQARNVSGVPLGQTA